MVKLVGIDHVGIGTDTRVGNHVDFHRGSLVVSRNSFLLPASMAWSHLLMARTSSVV
jgi:microsomal dipeptidase-like Zn-dependent dipeptidase